MNKEDKKIKEMFVELSKIKSITSITEDKARDKMVKFCEKVYDICKESNNKRLWSLVLKIHHHSAVSDRFNYKPGSFHLHRTALQVVKDIINTGKFVTHTCRTSFDKKCPLNNKTRTINIPLETRKIFKASLKS